MKTISLALATAATLAGCATQIPDNAKPYTCAQYNIARAKVTANPSEAYLAPDLLFFNKVNLVGFKSVVGKHPNREEALRTIDDSVDLHALQCRLAPDAIIHYTAVQVDPTSVRLGYVVEYPTVKPAAIDVAEGNLRMGAPVTKEAGMQPVKDFITNCAAKTAPAHACKLGGL